MPRSIKVQSGYADTLRLAIKRNGFLTQRALAERAGYSLATVKKFLGCKPVDFATFTELCDALNLDWETIADLGDRKAPLPEKHSTTTVEKHPLKLNRSQDWGAAIDVSIFYGRELALETLDKWIVHDRCRLVALGGIGGIGKTALTAKLAHHIEAHFDYLIWRSLKNATPIQEMMTHLLTFFLEQPTSSLTINEVPDTLDEQIRQLFSGAIHVISLTFQQQLAIWKACSVKKSELARQEVLWEDESRQSVN